MKLPRFRVTTHTIGYSVSKIAFKIQGTQFLELSKGPLTIDDGEGPGLAPLLWGRLKERFSTFDLRRDRLGALFSRL